MRRLRDVSANVRPVPADALREGQLYAAASVNGAAVQRPPETRGRPPREGVLEPRLGMDRAQPQASVMARGQRAQDERDALGRRPEAADGKLEICPPSLAAANEQSRALAMPRAGAS